MSDFVAGFAARHAGVAELLAKAFAPPVGFAPVDPRVRAAMPDARTPRHFSPADPDASPTAGWDPLDAGAAQTFHDPLAAAHAAGFAEGMAAAAATQSDERRDATLATELAAALSASDRFDRGAVAAALRQTVLLLVRKIVGETGISPELMARRIDAAAEMLADKAESAMLRVNPADVEALQPALPKTVFAVGDPAVARGSFVLESASTIVEDGPELWLEDLAHAIEGIALPAIPPC